MIFKKNDITIFISEKNNTYNLRIQDDRFKTIATTPSAFCSKSKLITLLSLYEELYPLEDQLLDPIEDIQNQGESRND